MPLEWYINVKFEAFWNRNYDLAIGHWLYNQDLPGVPQIMPQTLGYHLWFWPAFSVHTTGLGYTTNDRRLGHNSLNQIHMLNKTNMKKHSSDG
jgi:hypothetical protein